MKTLKESLLANIDDVLDKGDFYMNIYKKAKTDWEKLLDKKIGVTKYTNNIWVLNIKSPQLATYLLGDLKPEKEPNTIRLFINIHDALRLNALKTKRVTIELVNNYKAVVIAIIPYELNINKETNLVDKATVKELIDITINNLKKYLNLDNIDVVRELIKQNAII